MMIDTFSSLSSVYFERNAYLSPFMRDLMLCEMKGGLNEMDQSREKKNRLRWNGAETTQIILSFSLITTSCEWARNFWWACLHEKAAAAADMQT
jgi:hypothetical protein